MIMQWQLNISHHEERAEYMYYVALRELIRASTPEERHECEHVSAAAFSGLAELAVKAGDITRARALYQVVKECYRKAGDGKMLDITNKRLQKLGMELGGSEPEFD
jgi:hypothetical protein